MAVDSVVMAWSKPSQLGLNATLDGYKWKLEREGSIQATGYTKANEVLINSLRGAETYKFQVKAVFLLQSVFDDESKQLINSFPESKWGQSYAITLPEKLEPPSLTSRTEHTLTIRWEPYKKVACNGCFRRYQIRYKRNDGGTEVTLTSQQPTLTITGLSAGKML